MSETEILSEENIHFPHTFVMEPVFIRHQRVSQNKGSCSAPQATLPSLVKSKKKKKKEKKSCNTTTTQSGNNTL